MASSTEAPRYPSHYTINTAPRLIIRSAIPSDAEGVFNLLSSKANFPYDDVNPDLSVDIFRTRIDNWAKRTAEGQSAFMVVVLRETDELIGFGGFNSMPREPALDGSGKEVLVGDTGLVIDHRHWRKGYATEAFCATVEFGFAELGCGHFRIDTADGNKSWRGFMQTLGLSDTETQRPSWRNEGENEWIYVFDRPRWEKVKEGLKAKNKWPLKASSA